MSPPLFSILLTNHNYARYVPAAIESALGQSYSPVEVIVVDDGSDDGSRELLAAYAGRITVVLKDRGGMASAVNAGLARCRGELVALLDSDDIFVPTKIERVSELALHAPKAVLYYHQLKTVDAGGRVRGRPWPPDVWSGDIRQRIRKAGGWWPRPTTSAMVFRRSFLDRIGPFPEGGSPGGTNWPDAIAGDLAPFLGGIEGLPEALAYYRVHGRNRGSMNSEMRIRQFAFEAEQLAADLRRLGEPSGLLGLERHLGIARAVAAERSGSAVLRALWLALRCPSLRARGRVVEAGQILLQALGRTSEQPHGPA